jgi:glutathione-regulated potassium-efflux system protein KefB
MEHEAGGGVDLGHAVALLAAGVIAVPIFRRLGLGAVLGYLAAGVLVGPHALKLFDDPEAILHVAELGVVMFLFLIGLDMRPAKLWAMRRDIFGLGLVQVLLCTSLLAGVAIAFDIAPAAAIIGASGFVLSSTAVIMKMMDDRGETSTPGGQRSVAILLLEDLMIIPLLALVALLAALGGHADEHARPAWQIIGVAAGAVALVFAAGKWLMNPLFGVLARSGAREVMTAAALLVVLGAAWFMQWGGLSMGMGAFLAGVLAAVHRQHRAGRQELSAGHLAPPGRLRARSATGSAAGRHAAAAVRRQRRCAARRGRAGAAQLPRRSRGRAVRQVRDRLSRRLGDRLGQRLGDQSIR